jgi:hypothetical protein
MNDKKGTSIDPGSLDDNNKRWLPEKMDDRKGMGHGSLDDKRCMDDKKVRAPRSLDDNNKRWSPENMDEKKGMGHWGLEDNKKRWYPENVAVLQIREVYPGSRIQILSIPDPGSKRFRIPDPHASKNLSIFDSKNWF